MIVLSRGRSEHLNEYPCNCPARRASEVVCGLHVVVGEDTVSNHTDYSVGTIFPGVDKRQAQCWAQFSCLLVRDVDYVLSTSLTMTVNPLPHS
jgi:hypothetical protein